MSRFKFQDESEKGQPNGYLPLDDGAQIPAQYLTDYATETYVDAGDAATLAAAEAYSRSSGVVATNAARIPLSGLRCWLDAADRASIAKSGSHVTRLADRSGNGQDFTAAGTQGPTIASESLNGRDTLAFDGTNTLVNTDRQNWRFMHETEATIFIVSMRHATGSGTAGAFLLGTNPAGYGMTIRYDLAGIVVSNSVYTVDNVTPHTPTDETWHTFSLYVDPTNGTAANRWLSYMDGADLKNGNASTGATTTGQDPGDFLLGDISGYDAHLAGGIAELLIFDRLLSDDERVQVETYLHRKWLASTMVDYVDPSTGTAEDALQALIDLGLMKSS